MKHIKTYENTNDKPLYKEGDYVELSEETVHENGLYDIYENIGIIVNHRGGNGNSYMYNVDYLREDFDTENITQNFVYESEIVRKLSQDEVDDLNAYIQSIKYNL